MKALFLTVLLSASIGTPFCNSNTYVLPCDVITSTDEVVTFETPDFEVYQAYGYTYNDKCLVKFDTCGTTSIYDDKVIDFR